MAGLFSEIVQINTGFKRKKSAKSQMTSGPMVCFKISKLQHYGSL